jgi:protein-tyrosine kinase
MERIKQAVENAKIGRANVTQTAPAQTKTRNSDGDSVARLTTGFDRRNGRIVRLDKGHLATHRIVAIDATDQQSRGFEMLRTQVSLKMKEAGFQTLGVTSPTPGCGKTVCSVNLAFSISRLLERTITLVDLDMRKPQVANYLGLPEGPGVEDIINGTATVADVSLMPESGNGRFRVLPTYRSSRSASELMASSEMSALVSKLRSQDPAGIVLFDLPPVLVVDDVMSFLPQLDSLLLVVAAGHTKVSEIKTCERLLGADRLMGIVLNKSDEKPDKNYYYSSSK